ncbi:Anti-sigma regulatory factor (Ser/Thr protein kinase) [Geodermatophilus telluris]|uniref:Anti-sigma regulatory factor (Ser/Thr protein kinase) n=1 Tax=Geodermatophilus telluris TaxID=1190417 RepID=A0A1G6R3B0_9ACTN|nr:sensor histidine kinase [Geodermatophilus telluris]SDC98873.1 Anti-sigma regulatory factor (Ser/Thr protein kinase) [Geodermatophilus telluris]
MHRTNTDRPGSGGPVPATGGRSPGYRHDALVYDDVDTLTAVAAPWLLEGLAAGDAALVAAGPATTGPLREAVGHDPRVLVVERHALYRARTPTAITAFRRFADEHAAPGHRLRVVGETDYGTTAADWREWQAYEAVINTALRPWPLWGLCVFDAALPAPILASVRKTHPRLVTADGRSANPDFLDPATYLRSLPVPVEPLESTPPALADDDIGDYTGLRRRVRAWLDTVDGPDDVLEDFLLAVDEMTSNAVRHGTLPAGLRLWTAPGRVVATVRDSGSGLDDPFAGYGPAHGADLSHGGMGLWLARQLCDHVAIRRDADGVSVRLTTTWS